MSSAFLSITEGGVVLCKDPEAAKLEGWFRLAEQTTKTLKRGHRQYFRLVSIPRTKLWYYRTDVTANPVGHVPLLDTNGLFPISCDGKAVVIKCSHTKSIVLTEEERGSAQVLTKRLKECMKQEEKMLNQERRKRASLLIAKARELMFRKMMEERRLKMHQEISTTSQNPSTVEYRRSSVGSNRPQTQPQAQPQTRPQTRPQTQSQTRPQTQSQTRPQTRPQTQSQTGPQTRPQTQPQTRHQRIGSWTRPSRPRSRRKPSVHLGKKLNINHSK
ncbi:hypothetical protein AAMO2058_000007900 [Amorphochlora amoebiformis]